MSIKVKCLECDKEFVTSSENEIVCSLRCGQKRKKRLRREQSRVKKIDDRFKSYCTECGKRIVSYNNIFTCSKKCNHKRKLRLQRERKVAKPRSKRLICKECHCFITEPKRRHVCSDACGQKRKNRLERYRYGGDVYDESKPDIRDFPFDIPDDARWMAERDITIAREWVKNPTGSWRKVLEDMATAVRRSVKVQKERRDKYKKLNNRKFESG